MYCLEFWEQIFFILFPVLMLFIGMLVGARIVLNHLDKFYIISKGG